MGDAQLRILVLLIALLFLEVARSTNVRNFFRTSFGQAENSLSAGHGSPSAQTSLDWHLAAYWGVAAIILITVAGQYPTFATYLLSLVIIEELLVHWSDFAHYLAPPTK